MPELEKLTLERFTRPIKVFLVTADLIERQMIYPSPNCQYVVPPRGLAVNSLGIDVMRDNTFFKQSLSNIVQPILPVCIYEHNRPNCYEITRRLRLDGIIIPIGHADISTLESLDYKTPEEAGIPVFEAYKHFPGYRGYEGTITAERLEYMAEEIRGDFVHNAFKEWAVKYFKAQDPK